MSHKGRSHNRYAAVFGFFLSMFLFGILFIYGLYSGAFHEQMILSKVNESNYYEESYQVFLERTKNILTETKLPDSAVEQTYSLKRFHVSQRKYINHILSGKDGKSSSDSLKEELVQLFQAYLTEKEIPFTPEIERGISETSSRIDAIYQEQIEIPFLSDIAGYRTGFIKISLVVLPCLIIAAILSVFMLLKIFSRHYRGLRYIAYSAASASIMTAAVGLYLQQRKDYAAILQKDDYYKNFISLYTKGSVNALFYQALIGIITFVILFIVIKLVKARDSVSQS